MCQVNEADFGKDPNESEFSVCSQSANIKSNKQSKQLLLYKEKDCIKGIEMKSELNSNDLSNSYDFHSAGYLLSDNTDTLPQNTFLIDEQDHSDTASSPISNNFNFICPSFNNNSKSSYSYNKKSSGNDLGRRLSVASVTKSYPQYAAKTVEQNILPRKRGKKPKSVWEKAHNEFNNTNSRNISENEPSEPTVPCTMLGQQSYTQVSVEEVHVAETRRTGCRRGRKKKSVMLKRKIQRRIVQSYEYQPSSIKKGHATNLSDALNSGRLMKNNKLDLVKKSKRIFDRSVPAKYGPELLPPGWKTQIKTRKSGKTAGLIDIYFITPEGNKLRSRGDAASYIEKMGLPYLPEEFNFSKKAYESNQKCLMDA